MIQRIVYTAGTFDLLHAGHLNLLRECYKLAGLGGEVVVGVNTDELVLKKRGVLPVMNQAERKNVIDALKYVTRTIYHDLPQSESINRAFRFGKHELACEGPKDLFLVVGSDWAKKDFYEQLDLAQENLDSADISLVYVPYTPNVSSTDLRDRILKGR